MNAFAQLREQLNVIHGELALRGIHSKKIDNATYSIETLAGAYMEDLPTYEWEGIRFTPTQRRIVDLLYKHRGHSVSRSRLLDAMFPGGEDDHLTNPRKHIDVYLCNIRKKIAATPYEVRTVWGEGFTMLHKPSALALTALQELQAH